MKSTANRTRPKIIKAGIVGLTGVFWAESLQGDYGGSAGAFQTVQIIGRLAPVGNSSTLPSQVNKLGCWRPARSCASTAATAVMFKTPRAVTEGVRICAGRAGPIRIGPTGTASVKALTI